MLTNPTIETLKSLKLHGRLEALKEQQQTPTVQALSFEERIALLVDRERLWRENLRRTRLLRGARLKVAAASIEDINYKAARSLDKRQIATLATGERIRRSQNLLITGATGSGKTWIACALAQQTWYAPVFLGSGLDLESTEPGSNERFTASRHEISHSRRNADTATVGLKAGGRERRARSERRYSWATISQQITWTGL